MTRVEIGFDSGVSSPVVKWTDVSEDFASLSYDRGKNKELDTIEAGECTFVLDNADGKYTPGRQSSPYVGKIKARVPIRAYTVLDGNLLHVKTANANTADMDQPRFNTGLIFTAANNRWCVPTFDQPALRDVFEFKPRLELGIPSPFYSGLPGDSDLVPVKAGDRLHVAGRVRNVGGSHGAQIGVEFFDHYFSDGKGNPEAVARSTTYDGASWATLTASLTAPADGWVVLSLRFTGEAVSDRLRVASLRLSSNEDVPLLPADAASGTYPEFRGFVDTWDATFDQDLSVVEIKAVDALAVFSRPVGTFYRENMDEFYRQTAATQGAVGAGWWWPCTGTEDDNTASPRTGSYPLKIARTAVAPTTGGFTSDKTFDFEDGTSGGFTVADEDPTRGAVLQLQELGKAAPPLGWRANQFADHAFETSFWFKGKRPPSGRTCLFHISDSHSNRLVGLWLNPNGSLTAEMEGYGISTDESISTNPNEVLNDDPILLGLAYRSDPATEVTSLTIITRRSRTSLGVNGFIPVIGNAVIQWGGRLNRYMSSDFMRGTMNHIQWSTGSYYGASDVSEESVLFSETGERDLLGRLLDWVEFPGSRMLDPSLSILASPSWEAGTDANGLMSEVAGDASGTFLVGAAGEASYHNRHRRLGNVGRWNLSEWANGLKFQLDSQYVYNDVTAERLSGLTRNRSDQASMNEYGRKSITIRRNVADPEEMRQAAGWFLHRYRESQPRCEQLVIDASAINGPNDVELVGLAHGVNVSDRIRLHSLPPTYPAPELSFFVEGLSKSISVDGSKLRYRTTLQVSDAFRSSAWILEDDETGRLDSESCTVIY
ncbi:hypothetical protein AB0M54_45980 [Actinoplanes sp. NPDC051470]|uniref:hypothetical protein n=1 Tax=Actinoplanes sp. NPDC051470 TaxID=3157224 RepID=UPI003415809F